MKFYFFHLMPYAALDLDYDRDFASASMVLPNSYYDPIEGSKLYQRYIDELELAARLGYDGVCVNEHHQTAYGLMPTPGVIAGALARTTKDVKIAMLGRALPLVNNPLQIAEEYAMLDNISAGRLIAGFVRGIGVEYHVTGTNPTFSLDRFHEAHDLIVRAWTETGPFPFEGQHYHFQYVNLWPRPFQQPHPPIWLPSQGSDETIRWSAHPDRKYVYLNTYAPFARVEHFLNRYQQVATDEWDYEASAEKLGWAVPIYVAETDAIARREAKPHIEAFYNKYLRITNEMLMPPGYSSPESLKAIRLAKRELLSSNHTLDEVDSAGLFIVGSPQTVIERIEAYAERAGFGQLVCTLQFATLPHELTKKNLELFAKEVIPHFRNAVPAGSP
jgi:alkanesulfonate monooxygenase SsuD/methylene tetrahydromethanopterin reductase-like flavin-dependent oxidoreductase (luciferase family)